MRRQLKITLFFGLLFVELFISLTLASRNCLGQEPVVPSTDLYCGPRCVSRILELFSIDYDWDELVLDCQPELLDGASLAALKETLEKRGVNCRLFSIHNAAELQRLSRGIIFLPPEFSSANSLGHFLVFEILQGGKTSCWPIVSEQERRYLDYRISSETPLNGLSVWIGRSKYENLNHKFHTNGKLFFFVSFLLFLTVTVFRFWRYR